MSQNINKISPILHVETIEVNKNGSFARQNGSDSLETSHTIFSNSLSWGIVTPGQFSETKIIYLHIRNSIGINNIKISLIDIGDLEFDQYSFGVDYLSYVSYNYYPQKYFNGVNVNKSETSSHNVMIPNLDRNKSRYVYLNFKLPDNYEFKGSVIRFKWFFDYIS
jgi:hypothetical protein